MSVNKVILVGRCGKDPEVRMVGENKVANFTIATTEKYKDREETEWHNVSIWGKLAEVVEKYVGKGSQIYVEGRIKTEKYTKDGQDKFLTRILASSIQLLGKREENAAPAQNTAPATPKKTWNSSPLPSGGEPQDDDLPF